MKKHNKNRIGVLSKLTMGLLVLLVGFGLVGCGRGIEGSELPTKALFSNNLVALRKDGKWGYLDTKGKEVIPFIYDNATMFTNGHAVVMTGDDYAIINTKGKIIVDEPSTFLSIDKETGLFWFIEDGKAGLMSTKGAILAEAIYEVERAGTFYFVPMFSSGLAKVVKDGKTGFINTKGKEVIACSFEYASDFQNGFAVYKEDDVYGYINTKGEVVIEATYKEAQDFDSRGIAIVGYLSGMQKRYKAIDTNNELLISGYPYMTTGYGYILGRGESQGNPVFDLYDATGEFIYRFVPNPSHLSVDMQLVYRHVLMISYTEFQALRVDVFNYDGTRSFPIGVDRFGGIFYGENNRLTVAGTVENKLRLVNQKEVIYLDIHADAFMGYNSGFMAVAYQNRSGVVDIYGRTIVDFEYNQTRVFDGGFFVVERMGLYGIYNNKGKLIIPLEYENYRST